MAKETDEGNEGDEKHIEGEEKGEVTAPEGTVVVPLLLKVTVLCGTDNETLYLNDP